MCLCECVHKHLLASLSVRACVRVCRIPQVGNHRGQPLPRPRSPPTPADLRPRSLTLEKVPVNDYPFPLPRAVDALMSCH